MIRDLIRFYYLIFEYSVAGFRAIVFDKRTITNLSWDSQRRKAINKKTNEKILVKYLENCAKQING